MRRGLRLTACLGLWACGTEGAENPPFSVTDSAGVRVVANEAPAWPEDLTWQVGQAPIVTIGAVEAEQEYLLDRVMGASRLSDGGIVVADMGSSELRFYDDSGWHVRSVGGPGEGPGEFRQIMGLHRMPDGGLAVDDGLERLQVFDAGGRFLGAVRRGFYPLSSIPAFSFHEDPLPVTWISGFLEDGTFITWEGSRLDPTVKGEQVQDMTFSRRGPGGDILGEVVSVEGPIFHPGPSGTILRAVFGPTVLSATHPDGLLLGFTGTGELRVYDADGGLRMVARRPWSPTPVIPAMVEQYVQRSSPPLREEFARSRTVAQQLPAFSQVLVDGDGNVWVRTYDAVHGSAPRHYWPTFDVPSRWVVFDRAGRWLGEVITPPHLFVFEIGPDYVLGLYRDEVDVEYIRVHPLLKPTGP